MVHKDADAPELSSDAEVETVQLRDGRQLVVRHATTADLDQLQALYGRLSASDQNRRFFHAHPPGDAVTLKWVTVADRGGVALVVEIVDGHEVPMVIAEAGYALLDNGDGELAVTVDAEWRGWPGLAARCPQPGS